MKITLADFHPCLADFFCSVNGVLNSLIVYIGGHPLFTGTQRHEHSAKTFTNERARNLYDSYCKNYISNSVWTQKPKQTALPLHGHYLGHTPCFWRELLVTSFFCLVASFLSRGHTSDFLVAQVMRFFQLLSRRQPERVATRVTNPSEFGDKLKAA